MSAFLEAYHKATAMLEAVSSGPWAGCPDCGLETVISMDDERYQLANEPSFSRAPCETCQSPLHGDRYPAHAQHGGKMVHLDVCTDCLMYIANGEEPKEWS